MRVLLSSPLLPSPQSVTRMYDSTAKSGIFGQSPLNYCCMAFFLKIEFCSSLSSMFCFSSSGRTCSFSFWRSIILFRVSVYLLGLPRKCATSSAKFGRRQKTMLTAMEIQRAQGTRSWVSSWRRSRSSSITIELSDIVVPFATSPVSYLNKGKFCSPEYLKR